MRHFVFGDYLAALAYAAAGGQAVHTHRICGPNAPRCFLAAIRRGEDIAHLFDQDEGRLAATARKLGVRVVHIDRRGTPKQHIDLCGVPLRRALAMIEKGEP